jgi:hypothetical protein
MRAVFVLALILSVAAPPSAWPLGVTAAPTSSADSAMASPAGALCQLVRDSAKAEKTFASGWFAAPQRVAAMPPFTVGDRDTPQPSHLHPIGFDAPPLTPRPPPL